MRFIVLVTCLLFVGLPFSGRSVNLTKDAEISVLTCGPSELIHAIYGHTAIRVNDRRQGLDVVFNYGVFSFSAPNFAYRFAKGQTDYLLAAERYDDFYEGYKQRGRSIDEQVLNLTPEEKQGLLEFLINNAKPENREYRYNFFFDNCATRVRDVIENQVKGKVVFPEENGQMKSFRQHVTDYQKVLPWTNFGIQLVLGSPADDVANVYQEMFLPDYLEQHFAVAQIENEQGSRSLVKESHVIYNSGKRPQAGFLANLPTICLLILFLLVAWISFVQYQRQKFSYWPDYVLLLLNGLMGIILLWFAVYSEHPAMHPNYNLLWALPVNFLFAFLWMVKKWRPLLSWYWSALSVWFLLFFAFSFLVSQAFLPGFYLLAFSVFVRSVLHGYQFLRSRSQA